MDRGIVSELGSGRTSLGPQRWPYREIVASDDSATRKDDGGHDAYYQHRVNKSLWISPDFSTERTRFFTYESGKNRTVCRENSSKIGAKNGGGSRGN
jgi:hypothetical protein